MGKRVRAAAKGPHRQSLLNYINQAEQDAAENKYCARAVLHGESDVEQFFISRLIEDLGYRDDEIKPKKTLAEIAVAKGRSKENYRPDYALVCGKPRWIVDAKSPSEAVDDWAYQGAGYALGLNQGFDDENPCLYYLISNGLVTKVWKWDEANPVLSLRFSDFSDDNPSFLSLKSLLNAKVARRGWVPRKTKPNLALTKPSVEEVKRIFNSCHRLIWKAEKMNPQPAFFEFVKIMFVKLVEDQKLHADAVLGPLIRDGKPIPRDRLVFSTAWIEQLEGQGVENPVDQTLFKKLTEILQESVARGRKKPIFEPGERIRLHVGTIKQVVAKLEFFDMFAIDEDLNGRLFETFLSATMRGQELGQYFTPRSIVKLMTRLANPQAGRDGISKVLDACCGTAGFLIEVLTEMRNQIRANQSLTRQEAEALQERVAYESIYGIDAGREPPLARIARINMYLHGDGGSKIFAADSLDKSVKTSVGYDQQARLELEELARLIRSIEEDQNNGFDIALTNPPFSMGYSDALPNEKSVLDQYSLTSFGLDGTDRRRSSLRSNIMFIERYADLLKDSGHLVTVIDDSILSAPKNVFARDFIRARFIVRAVISIPGDAFQRVGARAKTSILYLLRRSQGEIGQPDAFMYECQHVGMDDVPMKTRASKAQEARKNAEVEIETVLKCFGSFLAGKKGPWLVPGDRLNDRLDVKSCLPRTGGDIVASWKADGIEVMPLENIVVPIAGEVFNPQDTPNEVFTLLRVRYDGVAEEGEQAKGGELTYDQVQRPQENDLVASNIAAALGSVCVIPADLNHVIASHEFTIMRLTNKKFNPWFVWGFLRSAEVRARLLSASTGISRHRITWDDLRLLPVPVLDAETQMKIGQRFMDSVDSLRQAEKDRKAVAEELNGMLNLDNEWAVQRLKTAKPPK